MVRYCLHPTMTDITDGSFPCSGLLDHGTAEAKMLFSRARGYAPQGVPDSQPGVLGCLRIGLFSEEMHRGRPKVGD